MRPVKRLTKSEIIEFIKNVDKKTWVAGMTGIVALVLLWVFLIEPAWLARPRLRRELQNIDAQMRQFQTLAQKREAWEENEKIFAQLIEDARARIYKEGESALLLGQISRLAKEAGVDILASKPRSESIVFPPPYQDKFQTFNYDFTMQGGYHELGKLSASIESHSKLLRIQLVHMVVAKDDPRLLTAQFGVAAMSERVTPLEKKDAKKVKGASGAKKA